MDTLVAMAIDLACQLQADERCQAVLAAQKAADEDTSLQELIGNFNLKRMAINTEEGKEGEERDADKLRQLNTELREVYAAIMQNEHMVAYNQAKPALDELVQKIQAAITLAVQGQDPNLAAQASACSGDCGSCGGCH
ncbi:MAG: YlbF family regulator [Clostridia bacterium]|nr:YlbF family regulator [Clostridia bacterium]